MKNKFLINGSILAFIALLMLPLSFYSCGEKQKCTYRYVTNISHEINKYEVTVTENSGGNVIERGAGGAIIGGGVDLLLGGKGAGGAIVGGLLGAASTDKGKSETHKELKTDVTYIVTFNDSTIRIYKNHCPFSVGDSIAKNNCY